MLIKILFDEIFNRETPITKKQQLAIPPQMMPAQDENIRRHNLDEVAVGYSAEQARVEAMRCIQCAKPACIADCPVEINIPGFIKHIADNDFQSAIDVIKETSLLPSICGRVCPQETQCQLHCATGKFYKDVDKAVAIGRLERFVADWEREQGTITPPEAKPETGKKVAIVGSGPAGLVVAADVRREGHDVTLFEAFHKLGGVMRYGIPEFRLPNTIIDQEVSTLTKMGVKFQKNYVVGRTRKLLDLMKKDGFDSVFIGTGAGLPMFMGIEGENLVGVFSANEYLTRANLMKAYDEENSATPFYHSKNVAVLGGGNVAMDSARMALRLGAENVYVVYRRTEKEMPARVEEVEHAKEEGVQFLFLQNAKSIKGNDNSRVSGMEVIH
jgi:glutamate synthase (NADPH/NADH) small chain